MTTKPDSEEALEIATIERLTEQGWPEWANCYAETTQEFPVTHRQSRHEVVLRVRLIVALERLNPTLPHEAIDEAAETLTRDRSAMLLPKANKEVYGLLKDGVRVTFRKDGVEVVDIARVIDWDEPTNNDFFVVRQMWITGDYYTRRPDIIGFVNGLPLVFIELKKASVNVESAFNDNLTDYKDTIPQLFWYNAVVLLSNGSDARMGSLTAGWDHFSQWKKINNEGEAGVIGLDTMLQATLRPDRLIDLIENFTAFSEGKGGTSKIVGKNHQFLGVNNAIEAVYQIQENQGRLGVFWHTQGSGKSYSMLFFAQKIMRKVPGNWTFVVITDRRDLDDQIYKNFAAAGAVTEPETTVRAQSGAHLRQLLQEDHRYVFTLIHKFRTDPGEIYPMLSDRKDIIVITDEAHRSQYDTLAQNMRNALPNAAFIGFTGTPLVAGEEKTREVFGEYVSVYNFTQSIEDGATVPLYYENRIPEVQLTNEEFDTELEELLEEAELDQEQEKKLEREFTRQYHIITRDDRLDKVAKDIVSHFIGRGYRGKGMVVSIDKITTARMHNKVKAHWNLYLTQLQAELEDCTDEFRRDALEDDIAYMQQTEMGLVISQGQNEVKEFKEKGFDILPHRKAMETGQIDERFKDPADPMRLVFVCAMWLTGFDAPSISTIYLDKPMRNHTLMQAIARANRVFKGKQSGSIIDYIGVFRNLQKALAIYGATDEGGEMPVKDKDELVSQLASALAEGRDFCRDMGIDIERIVGLTGIFERIAKIDQAVELVLQKDETKKDFLAMTREINLLFKAILPDPKVNPYTAERAVFKAMADKINSLTPPADISGLMGDVEDLLDRSIAAEGFVIKEKQAPYNLAEIDFEALEAQFKKKGKNTAVTKLRGQISQKLDRMVKLNKGRLELKERFEKLIEEYNSGAFGIDELFAKLTTFTKDLNSEEKRGLREGLSEEELRIYDLLLKPRPELTPADIKQVKAVAKEMLETLKAEYLVLDWRKQQQQTASVKNAIDALLDKLPDQYDAKLFDSKCNLVYEHVYESYFGGGRSVYAE